MNRAAFLIRAGLAAGLWVGGQWVLAATEVEGPDKASIGELVILKAKTDKPHTAWAFVPSGKAIAVDSGGKTVYWAVGCKAGEKRAFLLAASDSPVVLQVIEVLGQTVIMVQSNTPVEAASKTIEVVGTEPSPDPPPPPPPPPVKALFGFVVEERHDRTPEAATLLLSKRVREALEDRLLVADKDVVDRGDKVPDYWSGWLKAAEGKNLPYLFLANESGQVLWEGELPKTVDDMVDLINKYKPPKETSESSNKKAGSESGCEGGSCRSGLFKRR